MAEKIKKKIKNKVKYKALKVSVLVVLLFLINLYIVLGILYKEGGFTVTLDGQKGKDSSLIVYESLKDKSPKTYLKCADIDFLTDLSIDWIPKDINEQGEGSHHGNHYLAYTFYAENVGEEPINYWSTVVIEKQDKDVDEALRFMIYKNGERVVYAKPSTSGRPEPGTIPFKDDKTIFLEKRADFEPGSIDKYTIVVFLEGSDPQCVDDIIGGEISMNMRLTEEHISNVKEKTNKDNQEEKTEESNKEENSNQEN